jgi:type IV pilus assembly PilX-like protein
MKRRNERGSALVFALILVLVLSVMAASLMFLARSETWSGMNYRMMTQARYGAEAGVQAAANFLMSPAYVPPAAPAGGNFAGFNTNVYPVTDIGGNPIFLSTLKTQPANYPNAQMQTAFANNVNGSLMAGNTPVSYTASAQLLSMVSITPFGTVNPMTIQTWQITAHGDIATVRNGEAEVVTILERYISPAFSYAAFADANGCGALAFNGNGTTDSYDSASLTPNGGTISPSLLGTNSDPFNTFGGDIGTNGNDNDSGANVTINGTLSVPNPTFGVCSAGNVTGLSGGKLSEIKGGMVQLPSQVNFPTPASYPPGTTNVTSGGTLGPCVSAPCSYGNINLSGGGKNNTLTLYPGVYNVDSISLTGNGQITIAPDPTTGQYGPVILNVAGSNNNPLPIDIEGNAISNPTLDPSLVQITYAGTGTVKIAGNGACAAVVYAPNSTVDFKGNGAFYGSVIANQIADVGNGAIHYDLKLKKRLFTVGNYTINSFTWNKY